MTESEIFESLFRTAHAANSNRGAVAACLVRNGTILATKASIDNPNRHAEDLLLEEIQQKRITIQDEDILYSTIQPCGERTPGGGGETFGDCAAKIINSPIKRVIYAMPDAHYSRKVDNRFAAAGITANQVGDAALTEKSRKIFNDTILDAEYIKQKGDRAFL